MIARQSLSEFIDNPMGKGSNAIASRQTIKTDLINRFTKLLTHKKITVKMFHTKNDSEFYFHLLIPSESTERRNTYDVVLKFTHPETGPDISSDGNLKRYDVSFFSNSPSFTYTYAYAFNLYDMLVSELSAKYDKQVFERPPVTRNPFEVVGYEKTIFFAAHYLASNINLLQKRTVKAEGKVINIKQFTSTIRTTAKIEEEIRIEKRRVEKMKPKEPTKVHSNRTQQGNSNKLQKGAKISKTGRIKPKGKITPRKGLLK